MNHKVTFSKKIHINRSWSAISLLTVLTIVMMTEAEYSYWQDPRVPAGSHPLAPAIGRLVDDNGYRMCTGWLTKGGFLITAGHCRAADAETIEFNVKNSNGSNGVPVDSEPEDVYTISSWVDSNNGGKDNDWAIFRVSDNPITGLQPIEAQLVYIDLQQDLTGDDCRTMGYGSDNDHNTRNYTLQVESCSWLNN